MARIGRNDPCPCGSGRKYKHCCLKRPNGVPLGWEESWPEAPHRGPSADPQAPGTVFDPGVLAAREPYARSPAQRDRSTPRGSGRGRGVPADPDPPDRWTGLPADDLFAILEDPFGVPELVAFPSRFAEAPQAPVLAVFEALAGVAEEGRLTTRSDGTLTATALRALAPRLAEGFEEAPPADVATVPNDGVEEDGAEEEGEETFVTLTRLAALRAGLLEKDGRRLRVSRSARRKLASEGPGGVYAPLFRAFVEDVPWSAGDDLPDLPAVEVAWPYALLLLKRFGELGLPDVFYAAAFLELFPAALDEATRTGLVPEGEDPGPLAGLVFTLRALLGFAALFGLAALEDAEDEVGAELEDELGEAGDEPDPEADPGIYAVYALPLLDGVMRLHVPLPDADAFFDAEGFREPALPTRRRRGPVADDVLGELQAAMAEREFESLEEVQAFADAFMEARNRAPLEEFHGLAPEQMHRLLTTPFDAPDLLEVPDVLTAEPAAPVLDLFLPLAEAVAGDGLKATAGGNLPRAFCRQAAASYFTQGRPFLDAGATVTGHREEDFHDLHYARRLARKAGLIRLARGRWLLTVRGRELMERHGSAGVYPQLLRVAADVPPWPRARRDEVDALVSASWPFAAWLLTRFGDVPRPSLFYEEAFVRAFPQAVDGMVEARRGLTGWQRGEQEMRETYAAVLGFLYRTRVLSYFAGFFGLARLEPLVPAEGEQAIGRLFRLEATPLLREAVRFRV